MIASYDCIMAGSSEIWTSCSGRYLRRYKQHAFCDQRKYRKREKEELESEGNPVPNSVYGPEVSRIRQLCGNVKKTFLLFLKYI
jgi:hypothetical protein